jgi:hypothetical protein
VSLDESQTRPERRGRLGRGFDNFVGFFDSVNKIVGAIAGVLALAAALGLVTLSGGGEGEERKTPTPVSFEDGELESITNERFAFSFQHPRTWEQEDAFNSDGSVFYAPDESAELRAFGVNASDGPSDVLGRVEYLAQRQKQSVLDEGGRVLSDDLRFVAWDGPNDDQTPAARITYTSRDEATGRPVTTIAMLTSQQARDVTIMCEVARSRFKEFEGACNQLVGTLKLHLLG